jgi:hypothetical protein
MNERLNIAQIDSCKRDGRSDQDALFAPESAQCAVQFFRCLASRK